VPIGGSNASRRSQIKCLRRNTAESVLTLLR